MTLSNGDAAAIRGAVPNKHAASTVIARIYATPGTAYASSALIVDASKDITGINNLTCGNLVVGSTTIAALEIGAIDGVTPGTIAGNKAIVVDLAKDAKTAGNFSATTLIAGGNASAGTLRVFPSGGAKGNLTITVGNGSGDTVTNINVASQAAARVYTIADAGANSTFAVVDATNTGNLVASTNLTAPLVLAGAVGTAGTVKIFPSTSGRGNVTLTTTDASGNTTTNINVAAQAAARVYTNPDAGGNASMLMTLGTQTLAGDTTFTGTLNLGNSTSLLGFHGATAVAQQTLANSSNSTQICDFLIKIGLTKGS